MDRRLKLAPALVLGLVFWGCGGEGSGEAGADSTARDLSLAPAESVATIGDVPAAAEPAPAPPARRTPAPSTREPARRRPPPQPEPEPEPSLHVGTAFAIYANDTLTSRHNKKGEQVTATAYDPIEDARGAEIIPAGAVFLGTISDIAPAESPGGQGRMMITFNRVEFGGRTYTIQARTDSLGTFMKGRGVTAGDAAKVGAGAVVGAVAGRIIGGNKTGTIVGAAAGAAAGAGIMAATRDVDIILPAGAEIQLVLSGDFFLEPLEAG